MSYYNNITFSSDFQFMRNFSSTENLKLGLVLLVIFDYPPIDSGRSEAKKRKLVIVVKIITIMIINVPTIKIIFY